MAYGKRKLTKVMMEYDNGDKEYIEGEDADKWLNTLNGALVVDFTHGGDSQNVLKNISWKKI